MNVIHEEGSKSFQRAELRSAVHFLAIVWWTGQQLHSQNKGHFDSFEINYPCWIRLHGIERSFPVVQFIQAANEDALLKTPPWPNAIPVQPGVTWLEFYDTEPIEQPIPDPLPEVPGADPTPGTKAHRALIIVEVGSPALILKPSTPGESLDLTIIQRKAAWFDRLEALIGEDDEG